MLFALSESFLTATRMERWSLSWPERSPRVQRCSEIQTFPDSTRKTHIVPEAGEAVRDGDR